MFYQLPPAGRSVRLATTDDAERVLSGHFAPYGVALFGSGTAALAGILRDIVAACTTGRPEVLLPAYTCPQLVSAILHAGARPILVDLEADRPWMDAGDLARKLSPRSVAIIAVHLFGIPERIISLAKIAADAGVILIEDGAQRPFGRDTSAEPSGDFVVLSFGRGKPVSVLEGGAVLVPPGQDRIRVTCPGILRAGMMGAALYVAKLGLYNLMRRPRWYWVPAGLRVLNVGETRFRPFTRIDGMRSVALTRLPANLLHSREKHVVRQGVVAAMIAHLSRGSMIDLPQACHAGHMPLLRYPILLSTREWRDRIFRELEGRGLGASRMYEHVLPDIPGMPRIFPAGSACPQAGSFADRLLTLPVHDDVSDRAVAEMKAILSGLPA